MASPLEQLKQYSPTEALAIIEALDKKRRDEAFVRYWEATDEQKGILPKFTPTTKIFGVLGGNRSGKTELGAFMAVAWALGKRYFEGEPAWDNVKDLPIPEKPNNIWVVGLDFPTLRDVIWREKLRAGRNHPGLIPRDPAVVTKTSDGDFQIFFANGSVITGKSADSGREKFQGASIDLAWLDEECDEAIFDEVYQRTADCAGKILLTLTPLTDIGSGVRSPWVFDLYEESRKGRTDVVFVNLSVLNNPHVPEDEKTKLKIKWAGHSEERARLYGEFIRRTGLVYPMWDRKVHVTPSRKLPREWRRVVSIDPAGSGTTAALWLAYEPGTDDMYVYRGYYQRDLTPSEHAKNLLIRCFGDPIDIWIIDRQWGSQRATETHKQNIQLYRESGIPCRLAEVEEDYGLNESREYLLATLDKTSRHPKTFVLDDDSLRPFIDEIEHYVWDSYSKGPLKGMSKDKPLKRNDHAVNAWQYACAMRFRGRKIYAAPRTDEEKKHYAALNSY